MIRHVFRSVVRYGQWDQFLEAYKAHNAVQARFGLTYRLLSPTTGPVGEIFEECEFESVVEMERRYTLAEQDPEFRESLQRFWAFVVEGQSCSTILEEHDVTLGTDHPRSDV